MDVQPFQILIFSAVSQSRNWRYNSPCDPAHLGFGIGGMALKSDDCFVVPLCREHHTIQHNIGERLFWKKHFINPFLYAIQYCAMSPCEKIKENYKDYFQEKVKGVYK